MNSAIFRVRVISKSIAFLSPDLPAFPRQQSVLIEAFGKALSVAFPCIPRWLSAIWVVLTVLTVLAANASIGPVWGLAMTIGFVPAWFALQLYRPPRPLAVAAEVSR
jgi:hypothetical protein